MAIAGIAFLFGMAVGVGLAAFWGYIDNADEPVVSDAQERMAQEWNRIHRAEIDAAVDTEIERRGQGQ